MAINLADVRERVLPNGMRVLVLENHAAPVVALNFWVRVGSNNETGDLQGWSHGIEHMLFKGTARRPPGAIAREIRNAGGETNAGTGYETTNYFIVVPREELATALDIHADVLMNSAFDPAELENERQVLIEENQMYRDRPAGYGITWEELFRLGFKSHPYRTPIGGPDDNLRNTPRERVLEHRARHYVPGNIVYVVAGDVETESVFRQVEEAFREFRGAPPRIDPPPPEPEQREFRFKEFEGDVTRVYGKIGFHIPPEMSDACDAVHVMAHLLGVGRSSRLYRELREKAGLVSSVSVVAVTGFDPGYLVVEFAAAPDRALEAAEAVFREMGRLQRIPVPPEELQKTRNMIRSDYVFGLETVEGVAAALGHYAILGDVKRAAEYPERMARVTVEDVMAAARSTLGVRRASLVLHVPRGTRLVEDPARFEARLGAAGEGISGGNSDEAPAEPVAPRTGPGKSAPAGHGPAAAGPESGPEFQVTRTLLDNGLTLLVEPGRSLPVVAVSAWVSCGSGEESAATSGLSHLMQQMLLKGAAGRSAEEGATAIEALGARLGPFSGRDAAGLSLSVLRDNFPAALALFRDCLRAPDFPEGALKREKKKVLLDIAALRDDSLQYAVQQFTAAVFDGHPYGMPVLGSPEAVPGFTREALSEWHRAHYVPERLVISVSGDLEPDQALDHVRAAFGDMAPGGPLPGVPPADPLPRARRVSLEKDVAQAVIVIGCPGPPVESPDRHALDMLMTILSGMGNRLFEELRDRQHLCYFTGAFRMAFRSGGGVAAYIGTRPENEARATEGLLRELRRAAEAPPTEEEMRRARNTIAGGYLIDLQQRGARASLLARHEMMGLGWEEALRYLDRIRAVSPEEVQAAARWFDTERYTLAVLKPGPG